MATTSEIADFVGKWFDFPRRNDSVFGWWGEEPPLIGFGQPEPRPTAEVIAGRLVQMGEFQALKLGKFLNTPDGALLSEAVEAVSPPFYRQDVELIVKSLQLAAQMQQQGKRWGVAVALGITAVGVVSVVSSARDAA